MRALLIALIILLQCLLGYFYYRDHGRCCGADNGENTVAPPADTGNISDVTTKTGPILFNWAKYDPVLGDGWPGMRDSILNATGQNQKLEITGWYSANEAKPTDFENAGIARAAQIRKLFSDLPDDRIALTSRLVDDSQLSRDYLFEAASFAGRIVTENVKEVEDKTLIYFPPNSTNKLNPADVNSYLDDVAKRVIQNGEKIRLVGHTDNVGPAKDNLALGQRRAEVIKNYLVTKGVKDSSIIVESKGESAPIADNDSTEGKAKNRRTELYIIKQ
ncbi:MAG: OmpA family protein [Saprospiraceae bacterium]|nr:OmpA family protein [Saprospiraceae bacterium]